jgi:hypothetical protein
MRQVHLAGEKLFADYAGQTIPIVDHRTGEISTASIFVATLGASNYTFACATLGQTKHDWLQSIEKALQFIGGVTAMIVPDNPKAMVTVACPFEPGINRSAVEFADYYGTVILPARPGRPKDKAKVENAVLVVERWILARLRNRTFFNLHELNEAIVPLLDDLNSRAFKKLPGCRKDAYLSLDRPALRPLPSEPYDHADWEQAKVNIDYHVAFGDAYYSVPINWFAKKSTFACRPAPSKSLLGASASPATSEQPPGVSSKHSLNICRPPIAHMPNGLHRN